jgi:hypothetical protein
MLQILRDGLPILNADDDPPGPLRLGRGLQVIGQLLASAAALIESEAGLSIADHGDAYAGSISAHLRQIARETFGKLQEVQFREDRDVEHREHDGHPYAQNDRGAGDALLMEAAEDQGGIDDASDVESDECGDRKLGRFGDPRMTTAQRP